MSRQGGPERGDAVHPSILVEGQEIEITFDDDHSVPLRGIAPRRREAIENLSLMIEARF